MTNKPNWRLGLSHVDSDEPAYVFAHDWEIVDGCLSVRLTGVGQLPKVKVFPLHSFTELYAEALEQG